jgi:SAM-dependent methyltransferase
MEATMPRFARWMYDTVKAELGERVVDAGAGTGAYTDLMGNDGKEVVALEYLPELVANLKERFQERASVTVFQADLGDPAGLPDFPPADSMICLNVIEHIEDDVQALKNMSERVKPGGRCMILVPAYPWLQNSMDRAIGHYRRYGKAQLESRLEEAGWVVERTLRFNAFAVPGWFVGGILRRDTAGKTLFAFYDFLIPAFSVIERFLIRGMWGLSLIAYCQRPD